MESAIDREVQICLTDAELSGQLHVPPTATGLVVFAHGSGSSRFSPRNNAVARYLHEHQLGTLLFDLLTESEERADVLTREFRFDIPLLSRRLVGAVAWLVELPDTKRLRIGLFGSSTGAAAALIAAAESPDSVCSVVSRGGRPDLAGDYLPRVEAPTLMIVGGMDTHVLALNEQAKAGMQCECDIAVVPGATHLFEEAGTLEEVMRLAANWFVRFTGDTPG